jgi:hypothetical protein
MPGGRILSVEGQKDGLVDFCFLLTAEGRDRAEHAAVQHALWLVWVIVAHTCDFRGVGAVVQHIQHLVTCEAPICAQCDEDCEVFQ